MELRSLTLHYLNHSKKNKMCHHACVCSARTFSFLTYFRNKVSHPHEPACLSALPPPHQSSEPDIPPVAKWERKLLRSGALAQGSIGSWKVARSAGGLYTSLSTLAISPSVCGCSSSLLPLLAPFLLVR